MDFIDKNKRKKGIVNLEGHHEISEGKTRELSLNYR